MNPHEIALQCERFANSHDKNGEPRTAALLRAAAAALRQPRADEETVPFVEFFDAHEEKLAWEGDHRLNNWDEWRQRYERYEAARKAARKARAAIGAMR